MMWKKFIIKHGKEIQNGCIKHAAVEVILVLHASSRSMEEIEMIPDLDMDSDINVNTKPNIRCVVLRL
jgi:hypothetical protein